MFAIIETGGKQYKIEKGNSLEIERIQGKEGETINLDNVLLISDTTATKIGTPMVEGAYAIAKILAHKRGDKVVIFKMRSKKRYQRKTGHRQELTVIEITDIKASGGKKTIEQAPPKTIEKIKKITVKKTKAPTAKTSTAKTSAKKTTVKKEKK